MITLVNSNAASREHLIIFCCLNSISVNVTEERDRGNMSNGLNLVYARCYSSLNTKYVEMPSSGLNLYLLCVQQSGAAPFCENYAKLYFDAKHLEKGLNRKWWNLRFPFFEKNAYFDHYWKLPKFSRLDPAYHNIQLHGLLLVCPFNLGHLQYC